MVLIPSIISTISFFIFFGEIDGYDAVPAGLVRVKEAKQPPQDPKSNSQLSSEINLLTETLSNSVKGADETVRIAVQSCSDMVTNLGDRLGDCHDRDDQFIGLSDKLEASHGDDNMGSVWITIQVFSGISLFGIICTLSLLGYIVYQRSVINQLSSAQTATCDNCMRFNNLAFDHVRLNLSSISSSPQSTFIQNDLNARGGEYSPSTHNTAQPRVEVPEPSNTRGGEYIPSTYNPNPQAALDSGIFSRHNSAATQTQQVRP